MTRAELMQQAFHDHELDHHFQLGDPIPPECLEDLARRYDTLRVLTVEFIATHAVTLMDGRPAIPVEALTEWLRPERSN